MDPTVLAVGAVLALLPLILLARISHWTHATQEKFDRTNTLLELLKDAPKR